jgi:hypothetical protein
MWVVCVLVLLGSPAVLPPPVQQSQRVNPDAETIQQFLDRVNQYVDLRKKQEDTLKDIPDKTDPATADHHQRELAKLVQARRASARQGDIFTPAMQRRIRTILRPVFSGAGGRQIRSEILDNESKAGAPLRVNARYPDEVPLSTMPPQVLAALPKLPDELEYRFIGTSLILFDPHAHIVVDFMLRAYH